MQKEKIILGIDPSTNIMGYALITQKHKQISLLNIGIIHLSKFDDHYLRLEKIFNRIISIIDEFHPDEMALEAPFFLKKLYFLESK